VVAATLIATLMMPPLIDGEFDYSKQNPEPDALTIRSSQGWESLIQIYFEPDDWEWARRVMSCESGGNPKAVNPSSGASGLFQHIPKYWPERSSKAGWAGSPILDASANVAVAAWLFYEAGPSHWVCK